MKYCIHCLLLLLAGLGFIACQSEFDVPQAQGGLQLTLENVSVRLNTRSKPSELPKPLAEQFRVRITNASDVKVWDKDFTAERIPLAEGSYTVTASFGDNPVLAPDAPYYEGSLNDVRIRKDEVTEAGLVCKVANALVSVRFGRDEQEKARFDKFYQKYSVRVNCDKYAYPIKHTAPATSVYFRAGSHIELTFEGTLTNGREVSTPLDLSQSTFPQVFNAADHAIVTLTLPDPESAVAIDIAKVEVEEATLEETIPVSWLPIPQVKPAHHYDAQGVLQGTDLSFTDSYPGMAWKVEVTNAAGELLRSAEGTGALQSLYSENLETLPYLPMGKYTATFYLLNEGKAMKTGSRTFAVEQPQLVVTASSYTSYSKYLAGEVDAANDCNAYTIYRPEVSVNIAPALWNHPAYTKALNVTLDRQALADAATSSDASGLHFTFSDQGGKEPSFTAYTLTGALTFDQATAQAEHAVYITGLPVSWTPPTEGDWSVSGNHDWNGNYNGKPCVRIGQNTTSQPQYIRCTRFAVPAGVRIEAPYDVMMHGATVSTVLTLSFGENTYFEQQSSGGMFNNKDHYYTDVARFTTGAKVTEAKANNSYGSGQTCSRIYSLTYKYGK